MAASDLTASVLRTTLHYDKTTGIFSSPHLGPVDTFAFKPVGCKSSSGYIMIGIYGFTYRAHRLAWLYVCGEWPKNVIDHIDGNKANNAFANLRDVTQAVNMQNCKPRKTPFNEADPSTGTSRAPFNKWMARIFVKGKNMYLGHYGSQAEAHAAYLEAKRKFHPGCAI